VVHLIRRIVDIGIYTPKAARPACLQQQQWRHGLAVAASNHQSGGILERSVAAAAAAAGSTREGHCVQPVLDAPFS